MKSFILAALLFAAIPLRAQITLEHTYGRGIGLVEVDSGEWNYVATNGIDTITIYHLDHSLDHYIVIPKFAPDTSKSYNSLLIIAKGLFGKDSSFGYEIKHGSSDNLHIFSETGEPLFQCNGCGFGQYYQTYPHYFNFLFTYEGFKSTSTGTKMLIGYNSIVEVYSLPGRLPSSSQMLTVGGDPSNANYALTLSMAYPNPSSGRVRIAYELPSGVQSGEILLTTSDGREVKRYHITNAFNDLLIEGCDLPSGSYFYKLVTERGESAARRIVREK